MLFQNPEDLFKSEFVIELVSPYIKWCEGSCHDYGHLKGAFAMAAAAVNQVISQHFSLTHQCMNVISDQMWIPDVPLW